MGAVLDLLKHVLPSFHLVEFAIVAWVRAMSASDLDTLIGLVIEKQDFYG